MPASEWFKQSSAVKPVETFLENLDATKALAASMASSIRQVGAGCVLFLDGQLGAGKTTFTQHLIAALGHSDAVKSPTYTLVETYEVSGFKVHHFDLYRLADPEELEFMGVREYFNNGDLCIIEWPIRGKGVLPEADITLSLAVQKNSSVFASSANDAVMQYGRQALITPHTEIGRTIVSTCSF